MKYTITWTERNEAGQPVTRTETTELDFDTAALCRAGRAWYWDIRRGNEVSDQEAVQWVFMTI